MKSALLFALVTAVSTFGGSIARLTYDGITGTTVAALTNSTAFPDQPTFREQLDDFLPSVAGKPLFGFQGKENNGNNFGSYVRGYLEAPENGEYLFYIASDDASELRLSLDHTEANRRRIAFESGSGAALFSNDRIAERRSLPITLARGQKYYVEVLHKQGSGASYLQVGWQRPDGVQEIIPARHLAQHPLDAFIGRDDVSSPPIFNSAGLNAGDLVTAISATEGDDVILQLDIIAAQPTTFVWKENGEIIPDENLSFLRLPRVALSRNGRTFQAFVTNAFGQLTSASTTLSVSADDQRPSISVIEHFDNANQLHVTFSEPISSVTASNFELRGSGDVSIPISSVTLTNSEREAILSGGFNLQPGAEYNVTVRNIKDLAATPNTIDPNPTIQPFIFDPDLSPAVITHIQGVVGSPGEVRITFDESVDESSATNVAAYSAQNLIINSATLGADGKSLTLKTSAQSANEIFLINIRGIKDRSVAGNVLNTLASFKSELSYASEVLADGPVRYWKFNESAAPFVTAASGIDPIATGNIPLTSGVSAGGSSLIPSDAGNHALAFDGTSALIVPNGSDLNAVAGPWAKRTVEFWFNAASAPAPGSTGLGATAGLWEQGAATRSIAVYLWRDPSNENSDDALLTFHAFNSPNDGAGSPFGLTTLPPVIVQHPVKVGQTYHVAGVFDGDASGVTGNLILYVNGVEVGRTNGVGRIFNHTGDIQIGRGNGVIHTRENGNFGIFNGLIDDIAYFNQALSSVRIAAHYQAGLGATNSSGSSASIARIETRGNPNQVLVTFDRPIDATNANIASNFDLKNGAGQALAITSATLLPGNLTVRLAGSFNLQFGSTYEVTARNLAESALSQTFIFNEAGAVGIGEGSDFASRTIPENSTTTFKIVPTGFGPFVYQWFKNGVPIVGATQATLPIVATATAGGEYAVRVGNEINEITTTPALLNVSLDVNPPSIVSVRGLAGSLDEIRITLNEPVDPQTATNLLTFGPSSLGIISSTLSSDGLVVTLKTSGLSPGSIHELSVTGLKDRAAAGNTLTTTVDVTAIDSFPDEILSEGPVRYWQFDEITGPSLASLVSVFDSAATATATAINSPRFGAPSLVSNLATSSALQLVASATNYLTVPNGSDLNGTRGPWNKRTIDFFFRADSLPPVGSTGLASTVGLYEEGGANRGLAIYLWRDPANPNANEAELIFHAVNNLADGAGSPFGLPGGTATFVQHTVTAGQIYHVTAVFDGDNTGLNGNLILYLDGAEAARAGGIGQLYNHTSDIQIGRGNALTHLNLSGVLSVFDGVIDEFSIFNKALSPARIAELHSIAQATGATRELSFKSITLFNGVLTIEWDDNAELVSSETVDGEYLPVSDATSPRTVQRDKAQVFFRLRKQE